MDALFEIDDRDVLQSWIGGRARRRRVAEPPGVVVPGVRFAFYGRTSTAEFQDPVTSRAWQREMAATLVAGHGTITAEVFDVGCSRRVSWERRPEAAALLEQAHDVDRPFDAVVVGEFERAFTDRQFEQVARLLRRDGVLVWLPEAGGPVDLDAPTHRVLMQVLAAQPQREVVRRVEGGRAVAVEQDDTGRVVLLQVQSGRAAGDVDAEQVEVQRPPVHRHQHGARFGRERVDTQDARTRGHRGQVDATSPGGRRRGRPAG